MSPTLHSDFPRTWSAKVLAQPPLIAPARQFVYPHAIPGEEDALARGAMQVKIQPVSGGTFLATCALGFRDPSVPSGVFSCPREDDILLLAGGYAYLVSTLEPERCLHLPLRPVAAILAAPEDGLLLLAGFHHIAAVGVDGLRWQSGRVSWEGIALSHIASGILHGTGWDMKTDREVPFEMDLRTGEHTGGGFS